MIYINISATGQHDRVLVGLVLEAMSWLTGIY